MAKAKAKAKTTPKKAVTKKIEEPKVEEKVVEEKVVEEPKKAPTPKLEEVTTVIQHRNQESLLQMIKDFTAEVGSDNIVSVNTIYNPDSQRRQATIVYKK